MIAPTPMRDPKAVAADLKSGMSKEKVCGIHLFASVEDLDRQIAEWIVQGKLNPDDVKEDLPPEKVNTRQKKPKLLEEVRSVFSDLLRMFELDGPVIVDSVISSELLRGIPVISQIVTMVKFQIDVKNALFASKIRQFLDGMDELHRQRTKEKLRLDENYRNTFAQKLLLVLDRFSDLEKASILARIVSAYADDRIDRATMERLFDAVDRLFVQDLAVLINFHNYKGKLNDFIEQNYESLQGLAMCGLVRIVLSDGSGWISESGKFSRNSLGEVLVTILKDDISR